MLLPPPLLLPLLLLLLLLLRRLGLSRKHGFLDARSDAPMRTGGR